MVERGRSITESWAALASRPASRIAGAPCVMSRRLSSGLRCGYRPSTAPKSFTPRRRGTWSRAATGPTRATAMPCSNIGRSERSGHKARARWLAGDALARDIRVYRVPSLIAVTLAVLALFWLGQRHRRRRGGADRVGAVRRGAADGPRVATRHRRRVCRCFPRRSRCWRCSASTRTTTSLAGCLFCSGRRSASAC